MFNLTVDEVKELSKKYNMIPLTIECYADMDTPISVFKRMQTEKDCFLLESIGQNHVTARFSFIGRNPFISFKSLNDPVKANTQRQFCDYAFQNRIRLA